MKRRRDRRASLSFTHRTCRTSVMSESTFDPYPNLLPGQGEGLKVANVDPVARSRSLADFAFYFRAKWRVQRTSWISGRSAEQRDAQTRTIGVYPEAPAEGPSDLLMRGRNEIRCGLAQGFDAL